MSEKDFLNIGWEELGQAVNQEKQESAFEVLSKIDVSKYIEKKGKFNYLSWSWAWATLKRLYPRSTYRTVYHEGNPYLKTEQGYFVEVEVVVEGLALTEILPVLNNQNKPIASPSAFEINTSIKRCLAKAIALHGLGLYIYAGEDLPFDDNETKDVQAPKQTQTVTQTSGAKYPASEKQINYVKSLIAKLAKATNKQESELNDYFINHYKVESIESLESSHAKQMIETINKRLQEKA
jgi:hypothetical protein